jgi:hypothetical protein
MGEPKAWRRSEHFRIAGATMAHVFAIVLLAVGGAGQVRAQQSDSARVSDGGGEPAAKPFLLPDMTVSPLTVPPLPISIPTPFPSPSDANPNSNEFDVICLYG